MVVGEAPGKIVLFGEHSVVYGQPAIAAPVFGVKARVTAGPSHAFNIVLKNKVDRKKAKEAIELTVDNTLEYLGIEKTKENKAFELTIDSQVPVASGMGSGAAVGVATIKAVTSYFNKKLTQDEISQIDYKTEQLLHAHPSGIDNTVISHEKPIYFLKGKIEQIHAGKPLDILIANTGIRSSTRDALTAVHAAWEKNHDEYEGYFEEAGKIAKDARTAIEGGNIKRVGQLMNEFQEFYRNIKMSHPANERLIEAALKSGAIGSKISGAGLGGCV
ncbi:MAG: mevalonate kinase, partial [Candidatus Diapherotrites archaeon]|nr:mevalonate kinase [Candidatus Diapherotrites archaeon]